MPGVISRALALCVALVLGGCNYLEPRYPAEKVVFDEGMLGEWDLRFSKGEQHGSPIRLNVREREVPVGDGRTNPEFGASNETKVRAYEIVCRKDDPPARHTFHAYLLSDAGQTFLGLQLDPAELKNVAPFPFVLPLHLIFRIDKDGDRVLIRIPDAPMVAWVPLVSGWLGGEPVVSGPVRAPDGEMSSLILTNSIDRALEVYRERAAREKLWETDPGVLVRPGKDAPAGGE